jgi:hypothetical protein
MPTLHERLASARTAGTVPAAPAEADQRQTHRARPDPLAELRQKVHRVLVEAVGPELYDAELPAGQLHEKVHEPLRRALEEAFEAMAGRARSIDFDWMVMAINLQRQVGSNLAEVLGTVGQTIRERSALKRQVRCAPSRPRAGCPAWSSPSCRC